MGLGRLTSNSITHTNLHERAMGKHGLTRFTTARTWGKPPFSILYYTLCMTMGLTSKCQFVPGLPSESPKIFTTRTLATLRVHNFMCKPSIKMMSREKLQPLLKAFRWYVACHLHYRNPSFGFATKVKGVARVWAKRKPGSHITYSRECRKV